MTNLSVEREIAIFACQPTAFSACQTSYACSSGSDILLGYLRPGPIESIKLVGHRSPVTALSLNPNDDVTFLASAGSHYIILWNVESLLECHSRGEKLRGRVVHTLRGESPNSISLSPNNASLCVSRVDDIFVVDTRSGETLFATCDKKYNAGYFLAPPTLAIATISSTIELWDVEKVEMQWSTSVPNGYASCIAGHMDGGHLAIGFTNGLIRTFVAEECPTQQGYKRVLEVDTDKELFRSKLSRHEIEETSTSGHVIAVFIASPHHGDNLERDGHHKIFCATNQVLFVINDSNHDVEILEFTKLGMEPISAAHFWHDADGSVGSLMHSLFGSKLYITRYRFAGGAENAKPLLTILPKHPVRINSILKTTLSPASNKTKTVTRDKPVTFKSKIKSSGYTTVQHRKMFKPLTSQSKIPKKSKSCEARIPPQPASVAQSDWSKEIIAHVHGLISDTACNINHISLSECRRFVASALPNGSVVISHQRTKKLSKVLCCHNDAVLRCGWSNDTAYLLTCSKDCSAHMYSLSDPGKPVMQLESLSGNFGKGRDKIQKEVTHAQFYYIDKFILLAHGNSFMMYAYYIDPKPKSDVQRYLQNNKYKVVKSFQLADTQTLNCMAAANNLYSYTVLACGSDKRLHIYDMNVGTKVSEIDEVHTRPVSQVTLSTGSAFLPCASYDLFFTTSPADGIKAWDVRTLKCAIKYKGHPDGGACPFDVSPCGKFICTAGDDRRLHIYDIRKNSVLQSSSYQREKFSSVAFAKDSSEIVAGLQNGTLISFDTLA